MFSLHHLQLLQRLLNISQFHGESKALSAPTIMLENKRECLLVMNKVRRTILRKKPQLHTLNCHH